MTVQTTPNALSVISIIERIGEALMYTGAAINWREDELRRYDISAARDETILLLRACKHPAIGACYAELSDSKDSTTVTELLIIASCCLSNAAMLYALGVEQLDTKGRNYVALISTALAAFNSANRLMKGRANV